MVEILGEIILNIIMILMMGVIAIIIFSPFLVIAAQILRRCYEILRGK